MNKAPGLQSLKCAIIDANVQQRQELLRLIADDVRQLILDTSWRVDICDVDEGFSVCDILTTLFFAVLRLNPVNPEWPQHDRFILSKGNCLATLYAVLGQCGFIPIDELASFIVPPSNLNSHLNYKIPGVEASAGPPGQGLPIGLERSIAAQLSGANWRTFVVLDDGELREGSTWEAATAAGHHALSGLTVVVNCNWLQPSIDFEKSNQLPPLVKKWHSVGWSTAEIDGHDFEQLYATLSAAPGDRPRCVIARTQKGRGR